MFKTTIGNTSVFPIFCAVSLPKFPTVLICYIFYHLLKVVFLFPPPWISMNITDMYVHHCKCIYYMLLTSLLFSMCVCLCVCGKGGTHSLLPGCHWAGSPDQQPCRPDRRWARLPLQPILCSPSAAPDSAGRSPLEEVEWQEREEREDEWERINVVGIGGKGEEKERSKGGNWTSSATAVKWGNSVNRSVLSSSVESHPAETFVTWRGIRSAKTSQ